MTSSYGGDQVKEIKINASGITLEAFYATGFMERYRGLSGKEGSSMLMRFPFTWVHGIVMRGMKYPLDVYWLDGDLKVTSINRDFSVGSRKTHSHISKYVLETPAGMLPDLKKGDTISVKR